MEQVEDTTKYDAAEENFIARGLLLHQVFDKLKTRKSLASRVSWSNNEVAFEAGNNAILGRNETIIRATPRTLLAYLWLHDARDRHEPDSMEVTVVEHRNEHNKCIYVLKRPPLVIAGRDFLGRAIWKKIGEGHYIHIAAPAEQQDIRQSPKGCIRGRYTNAAIVEGLGDGTTRLTCLVNLDFGGTVPSFIPNLFIKHDLTLFSRWTRYFWSRLDSFDEKNGIDSKYLGGVLAGIDSSGDPMEFESMQKLPWETKRAAKMRMIFAKNKVLREKQEKYGEFFLAFFQTVSSGTSASISYDVDVSPQEQRK